MIEINDSASIHATQPIPILIQTYKRFTPLMLLAGKSAGTSIRGEAVHMICKCFCSQMPIVSGVVKESSAQNMINKLRLPGQALASIRSMSVTINLPFGPLQAPGNLYTSKMQNALHCSALLGMQKHACDTHERKALKILTTQSATAHQKDLEWKDRNRLRH